MTAQELVEKARQSADLAIGWARSQADPAKSQVYLEQANIWRYVAQEVGKLT